MRLCARKMSATLAAAILLLLLPLILLAAEPPLTLLYRDRLPAPLALILLYASIAAACLIVKAARLAQLRFAALLAVHGYPLVAGGFILWATLSGEPAFGAATFFFMFTTVTLLVFIGVERHLHSPGLFGLVLVLGTILSLEFLLRRVPDDVLRTEVKSVPTFAELAGSSLQSSIYAPARNAGCSDLGDGRIRILVFGGSVAAGAPKKSADHAYPMVLQRLLDERVPGRRFEVINAAKPGQSAVDALELLNVTVESIKPDVVIVPTAAENAELRASRDGLPLLSDKEIFYRKRFYGRLAKLPAIEAIRQTMLYAMSRYYLTAARDRIVLFLSHWETGKRARVRPSDYAWAVAQIAKLGEAHNFITATLLEPYNRGGERLPLKYFDAVSKAAKDGQLIPIDPRPWLAGPAWYFYDQIHPNGLGHRAIGLSLYAGLLGDRAALISAKVGLDDDKLTELGARPPRFSRVVRLAVETSRLKSGKVTVEAAAPLAGPEELELVARVDRRQVAAFPGLSSTKHPFTIVLPASVLSRPLVEVELSARSSQAAGCFPVGATGVCSPYNVTAVSGGGLAGACVSIKLNGERYDFDRAGYNVVVVDGVSGEVRESRVFNCQNDREEGLRLARFIAGLQAEAAPPLVIVAVKSDGGQNLEQEKMITAFRRIGGSGRLPKPFESFVLIGAAGAVEGTAIERSGPQLINVSFGDEQSSMAELIEAAVVE